MINIAVLLTSYNRVQKTLMCLDFFYNAKKLSEYNFDVFLVDDNSPDKTGDIVKKAFPLVNVIKGSGSLYWNQGMILAWKTARNYREYDFYLWLNDDTYIYETALNTIFTDYFYLKNNNIESIIVSALMDPKTKEVSYSGRYNGTKVIPNGFPQKCNYITGNFVLVSKEIYNVIGMLDKKFSHGIGDNDYGLMVLKRNFSCYVTSRFVGECEIGKRILWYDSRYNLRERYSKLISVTGGNIVEYFYFVRKHRGCMQVFFVFCKTLIKLFFPKTIK